MQKLKEAQPNDFPLPASLFYKRPNGRPGSTWGYLRRGGEGEIAEIQAKQIEYGSRAMTFIVYHAGDPQCVVNPFIGCPSAAQIVDGYTTPTSHRIAPDNAELNRWKWLLAPGLDPHVYLVPCLFCGDDRNTTNNCAFHEFFLKYAIPWLDKYSKAYLIATEASKSMSVAQMFNLIEYIKRYTIKPVGVHLQWNRQSALPTNLDWLDYEFHYHPADGYNYSVSDVVEEAKDVIAKCPAPVFFGEMDIDCESDLARAKVQALKGLSGCWGLPGPI